MEPYRNFKVGLEDSLLKVPKAGERVLETLKRYKSGFKQLVVPGMFFEDMGLTYLGPVDGHDVRAMRRMFLEARAYRTVPFSHVLFFRAVERWKKSIFINGPPEYI